MRKKQDLHKAADKMLRATSRTFYIPINRLSPQLKEAVSSAYLCMRAIDEIEDHPALSPSRKIKLLKAVGDVLTTSFQADDFTTLFQPHRALLPAVTTQMVDWIDLAPPTVRPQIFHWTSVMAHGMAEWVEKDWQIHTQDDLESYTYYVAGLVGLLLDDIWTWYDGTQTDRELAIAYGRGLQAVNIVRNRKEDFARGVDFFPDGWDYPEMIDFAKQNLAAAERYTQTLSPGPILEFCKIPLALAQGTLKAIELGKVKLSRTAVISIVEKIIKN
jgi:farnesyl-diphosphate farnesyltransferase